MRLDLAGENVPPLVDVFTGKGCGQCRWVRHLPRLRRADKMHDPYILAVMFVSWPVRIDS